MSSSRRYLLIAVGVVLVVGLGAVGVVPRLRQREAVARVQAQVEAPRPVRVGVVKAGTALAEMTLPATATPFYATSLYAKSLGFLRKNHVDAGDRIKRGQLLAEIYAPENDEDVRLAQAQLEEAAANIRIAQSTADRNGKLAQVGVVSRETADQLQAQANSAAASVKTREAQLSRVSTLRGYQRIVAPFDGVVSKRNYDPGALVGSAPQGGLPLFEVAQVETLRVFVDVPQWLAAGVGPGVAAQVWLPTAPALTVAGKVVRTSVVLDQSTRTLHTEVHIPGDGNILPGAFVYIKLAVPRKAAPLTMPASALIVRKEGTLVARVVQQGTPSGVPNLPTGTPVGGATVKLQLVQIGRDLGKEVELSAGATAGERVVLNPPDDLADGAAVLVVEDKPHGTR